jgi:hypothetical protein
MNIYSSGIPLWIRAGRNESIRMTFVRVLDPIPREILRMDANWRVAFVHLAHGRYYEAGDTTSAQ